MRKKLLPTILLVTLAAGVAWGVSAARTAPREIVLVASNMAFYIEGNETPNPALRLRRGETVRLTLINRDRGMRHDLAIAGLGVATDLLTGNGDRQTIRLQAPARAGSWNYTCSLHTQTMRGLLEVG